MEHETGLIILLFVVVSLLIGAFTRTVLKSTNIPYTVALLFIGIAYGFLVRYGAFGSDHSSAHEALDLMTNVDPHLVLSVFLPTLIFESAYAMEVHLFKRIFAQIIMLAVPGLLICTALTAVFAKFIFPWEWSWTLCLLFGVLISATDPVAVVSLLKEVSSRKRLETLIEGESLLNDGTAIVFFSVLFAMLTAVGAESSVSILGISWQFVYLVSVGIIIGLVIGYIAIFWINKIFNDPMIEITITIAAAYMIFYIAEHTFHVSGIVGVVTFGLMLASVGKTRVSPEVSGFLHKFWEMMAFIANTLIFILVGAIIAAKVKIDSLQLWIMLACLYIAITVIRASAITMLTPILKRISIGFNKQKAIVLTWGGLRGAVSLALALVVVQANALPEEILGQIMFLTAGIVVLTIAVNGSTMLHVLKYVNLDILPPAKQAMVNKALQRIGQQLNDYLPTLKQDELLTNANWESIQQDIKKFQVDNTLEIDAKDEDLHVACYRRLLETERKSYWNQFAEGFINKGATNTLTASVESALDGSPDIGPREALYNEWQASKVWEHLSKVPFIANYATQKLLLKIADGYGIARGYLRAHSEMLAHVSQLAPTEAEAQEITDRLNANKQEVLAKLAELKKDYPEQVAALETYSATRSLLNRELAVINGLVKAAVLDTPEANKLIVDVEQSIQNLAVKN